MCILQNVQFFSHLLTLSIMGSYGHARLSSEKHAEKERDKTVTPQVIADHRLAGRFSLFSYLHHVLTSQHLGRRDHLNPYINDLVDWDNYGIC